MIISIFNNKGGVGKTTLLYHLGYALAEMGKKVLFIDLDPQCNLTLNAISEDIVTKIWADEEEYIEDFKSAKDKDNKKYLTIKDEPRSIHFMLKPLEDGLDIANTAKPYSLAPNIDIIPGRLSLQFFESYLSTRWADSFTGNSHALRIIASIRKIADDYIQNRKYDYVLFDTSPSLGDLNKISVALSDYFFIPCSPDIFSIYGIKNIGLTLKKWKKEFDVLFKLLPSTQRKFFPNRLVKLLGYTLYKAQSRADALNSLSIPQAHYNHAVEIPNELKKNIDSSFIQAGVDLSKSIGKNSIIYSHNTFPAMAQKYHSPMWLLPDITLEPSDKATISGNRNKYKKTLSAYKKFATDIINRSQNV